MSALSVTELTLKIKSLIEPELSNIWVKGEISNYRPSASGHAYFNIKDSRSSLSVAVFGYSRRIKFEVKDGLEVLLHGKISIYETRGSYQLVADQIEPVGVGALQLAFEQLKEKLQKEGLFDPELKRPIPKFPRHISIVTSPQTAALQDVLTVLKRRAPHLRITVIPALVQGDQAAQEIRAAIKRAQTEKIGDLILLVRGGGSIEDLWCFNDEALAREIRASEIPIISGVGHETDFTIADFVSDLRAPTPSAAAEIASGHWLDARTHLSNWAQRLDQAVKRKVQLCAREILPLKQRVWDGIKRTMREKRKLFEVYSAQLVSPRDRLREQAQKLDDWILKLNQTFKWRLERTRTRVEQLSARLDALSPLKVLSRGYLLARFSSKKGDGKLVRNTSDVSKGDTIEIRFHDGTRDAEIL